MTMPKGLLRDDIWCSPFIMSCLETIEMDHVISELNCKGTFYKKLYFMVIFPVIPL